MALSALPPPRPADPAAASGVEDPEGLLQHLHTLRLLHLLLHAGQELLEGAGRTQCKEAHAQI